MSRVVIACGASAALAAAIAAAVWFDKSRKRAKVRRRLDQL